MSTPIKKVQVVFKTHLDVGYTDFSSVILRKYVEEYIPHAISLAEQLNADGKKRFIWTVGSFLIDYFLHHASPEQCARMETAIQNGMIAWHGCATTAHTELMDRTLLDFSLSLSQDLDKRFGTRTIGAKMTDVPGHTKALVPALAAAGIKYLHIGTNIASPTPGVPPLFRWKVGEDEVIVHYSSDYGMPLVIDGFDTAIEYAYTGDNTGPQNAEEIESILAEMQRRYPGAEIVASTISDVAETMLTLRDRLPVVTQEIGDTWIHGVGTDPRKVRDYNELLRLKEKWLADGRLQKGSEVWHELMTNLMLIAEHTWSVDIKKYLFDFTNWDKDSFRAARKADKTDISFIPDQYKSLEAVVRLELDVFRGGCTEGGYSIYEAAQAEQLLYIQGALDALPADLRAEANAALALGAPVRQTLCGETLCPGRFVTVGDYTFKVDGTGAINYLKKGDRLLVEDGTVGALSYQIFSAKTVVGLQYDYNIRLDKNLGWTEADYHKAGLCRVPDLKDRIYNFAVAAMWRDGNRVVIRLNGDGDACERYGCPREAELIYTFGDTVTLTLNWFDKDASRIPEAVWLGFNFKVDTPAMWRMRKVDTWVDPAEVVRNGNRKQHVVPEWKYEAADGSITLRSLHAGLCSVGARNIYVFDNKVDDIAGGMYYCLFNNRWGTNFKTWCEDEVSLTFEMQF